MSDEESRKKAEELRGRIDAARRGEAQGPKSLRDLTDEAAEKARQSTDCPPEDDVAAPEKRRP